MALGLGDLLVAAVLRGENNRQEELEPHVDQHAARKTTDETTWLQTAICTIELILVHFAASG